MVCTFLILASKRTEISYEWPLGCTMYLILTEIICCMLFSAIKITNFDKYVMKEILFQKVGKACTSGHLGNS